MRGSSGGWCGVGGVVVVVVVCGLFPSFSAPLALSLSSLPLVALASACSSAGAERTKRGFLCVLCDEGSSGRGREEEGEATIRGRLQRTDFDVDVDEGTDAAARCACLPAATATAGTGRASAELMARASWEIEKRYRRRELV